MNIKDLNDLVVIEATKLKQEATKDEINGLRIGDLDPLDYRSCIYGQMTGDCFNQRATNLIKRCATLLIDGEMGSELTPLEERNATEDKNRKDKDGKVYFSPIEVFIAMGWNKHNGNNKRLVAFLKNETSEIELK